MVHCNVSKQQANRQRQMLDLGRPTGGKMSGGGGDGASGACGGGDGGDGGDGGGAGTNAM
jgi:hypothetical protein